MTTIGPADDGALDLIFGPHHAIQLLVLPPWFEEANRTRRLIASIMRRLDAQCIGSRLPTLPGTGESAIALGDVTLADWRQTVARAGTGRLTVSFRAGALLDHAVVSPFRWRLAPTDGAGIIRDLRRAHIVNGGAADDLSLLSGYRLAPPMLTAIETALPDQRGAVRTIRLEIDPAPADRHLPGTPLWRRSEPGDDPALATALAADIADWARTCAAS